MRWSVVALKAHRTHAPTIGCLLAVLEWQIAYHKRICAKIVFVAAHSMPKLAPLKKQSQVRLNDLGRYIAVMSESNEFLEYFTGSVRPFRLAFHTDAVEAPTDVDNRGFCLDYVQQPCTNG